VTRTQWQSAEDLPPNFLEDIVSGSGPTKLLGDHGWCLNGAAVREDAPGDLVLELLTCANAKQNELQGQEEQEGSSEDASSGAQGTLTACPNLISTCSTPAAIRAYRHFMNQRAGNYSVQAGEAQCWLWYQFHDVFRFAGHALTHESTKHFPPTPQTIVLLAVFGCRELRWVFQPQ
jgi:hypothetical protein